MNTLPKSERLKGKAAVSALMSKGRWGLAKSLKYCYLLRDEDGEEPSSNRILVSVPKKLFKRAVKRNLLKRRLREAYRTQKDLLPPCGADLMFIYNCTEELPFASVRDQVATVLRKIGDERQL